MKKDVLFIQTDLCQETIKKLISVLTQEPLLQYPNFSKPFNITCDASNYVIGCALSQGIIGNSRIQTFHKSANEICTSNICMKSNRTKKNALISRGYNTNLANIIRRGLGKTFSRLTNVQYGIFSNFDIEFNFDKILDSRANKQNNLVQEKIRIVQSEISEANDTLNHVVENQGKLNMNTQYLNKQVQRNIQSFDKL